jgi:hypothetical protein
MRILYERVEGPESRRLDRLVFQPLGKHARKAMVCSPSHAAGLSIYVTLNCHTKLANDRTEPRTTQAHFRVGRSWLPGEA